MLVLRLRQTLHCVVIAGLVPASTNCRQDCPHLGAASRGDRPEQLDLPGWPAVQPHRAGKAAAEKRKNRCYRANLCTNSAGGTIGICRNGSRASKSASPVTIRSA